ncbi:hypothetical protein SNE35_22705 [Paucibacter sp. R3-3]|uniref:Uncharacterized protein n=1 Tax=Roseateles agri TaxID=3098619 RepID=A0ABU5DNL5_9BURK|nr:hypothetical protein [Paucibacter sp. R3-3]MDY0747331.1 hypothetical protein [Paucibacter sp. R3-3]
MLHSPKRQDPSYAQSGDVSTHDDFLKTHALEELMQLGYTVVNGDLYPPDHIGALMVAAKHPLAEQFGAISTISDKTLMGIYRGISVTPSAAPVRERGLPARVAEQPRIWDENSIAMAWNTVRAEARKLSPGHGIGDLLAAVEQYGERFVSLAPHFVLDFRPASEIPPRDTRDCLLLNPCDGFHIMAPCWCSEDGEFLGFRSFAGTRLHGAEFYVAWAVLPDTLAPALRAFDRRAVRTPVGDAS